MSKDEDLIRSIRYPKQHPAANDPRNGAAFRTQAELAAMNNAAAAEEARLANTPGLPEYHEPRPR